MRVFSIAQIWLQQLSPRCSAANKKLNIAYKVHNCKYPLHEGSKFVFNKLHGM